MKFFAAFAAMLAVASATPSVWTLQQLSEALENPTTDSTFRPVLEQALDIYMDAIFQGNENPIKILTAPGQVTYALTELDYVLLHTPSTSVFRPYLKKALDEMMDALFAGHPMETIDVQIPSFELSYWSLKEIDAALTDAATNAALLPYLEKALDDLMYDLFNGGKQLATVLIVPVNLVAASPIDVSPVAVDPAAPVTPVSNSPLVQIILNVQQSNAVDVVSPAHVVERPLPEPSELDDESSPIDIIAVQPIENFHP